MKYRLTLQGLMVSFPRETTVKNIINKKVHSLLLLAHYPELLPWAEFPERNYQKEGGEKC